MKAFIDMAYTNYDLYRIFHSGTSKDFSRNRKLTFPRLILFIARLCKRTLSLDLERFFADLAHANQDTSQPSAPQLLPCSVSAYSQQRKKLDPYFFRLWNEVLCQSFYHYSRPEQIQRWHGLRVIAADGSSVALVSNKALKAYFGGQSNQQGEFCAAKTFYYYDSLNQIIIDAVIAPYRTPELSIAYSRVDGLADDSVTVYDRNFCCYRMMALHLWAERPKRFLIRAKEKLGYVAEFLKSGCDDSVISLKPSNADCIRKMRDNGFIIKADTALIIRLVRVVLPGGGIEVLATNLMPEQGYSREELKGLYFLRWGVETSIDLQKNVLMLESFSGQSVESVEQDFGATIVMANLEMCLLKDAQRTLDDKHKQKLQLQLQKEQEQQKTQRRQEQRETQEQQEQQNIGVKKRQKNHPMQPNRNKAAFRIKDVLVELFMTTDPQEILQRLHNHFIRDVLPVRKDRSYERKRKNRRVNTKHKTFTNYKIA